MKVLEADLVEAGRFPEDYQTDLELEWARQSTVVVILFLFSADRQIGFRSSGRWRRFHSESVQSKRLVLPSVETDE